MIKEKRFFPPNIFLGILNSIFFKKPLSAASIKKLNILVYQVGNIGDLIVSTPVYRALRKGYPDAEITLLSSSGSKKYAGAKEIIKPLNYINKIDTFFPADFVSWKDYYNLYRNIRGAKYDLIVYLPSNLWTTLHTCRDIIFFFLTGIKYGIGFRIFEDYHYYLKSNLFPRNEIDRLLDLLKPLGIENGNRKTEFAISNESKEFISNYLSQNKIGGNEVKIAILPGGKYPSRLWPKQNFVELIDKVNEKHSAKIILLGSEMEKELTREIKKETKMKPLDSSGHLTVNQLGALIKECDLLITNDSGPMHIASAVGTPTVSIFSAVDIPNLWYPTGDSHRIFYNKVDCSPCFLQSCDNHICMEGISVETVFNAVDEQIKEILKIS